ncbi:MAG: response regulator [Anaerolineaceae bacterium]|nr:response regulator [Anaerolineaceae bacterium]
MTRVLLVEDTFDLLANVSQELELNGYEVEQAANGRMALDLLEKAETLPDIIVSDIDMPQVNGYELLATCQRHREWRGIPFIFLTALGDRKDVLVGKKLGADDYLVKPFRSDELIISIKNKLRRVEQIRTTAEQKLDKTRRDLLTMISHELRTPLSAIYGGSELLADSLAKVSDPMSRRMLDLVQSGAKRMRRLVEQIIFLTQLDSGSLANSLEKFPEIQDMQLMINSAYKSLEEEWGSDVPAISIHFQLPSEPVTVVGNPDFLAMMVQEGLRNAVTFSPQNGQIEITLTTDDQYAFVTITDQGPGIAAEDLPKVWERFMQINRGKFEQQGMGLGLALARESARLHHGECFLEPAGGQGMRFTLQMPLAST